jgi:hypothetical protein
VITAIVAFIIVQGNLIAMEMFSQKARDKAYREKRDKLLCSYMMLYDYELSRNYPSDQKRDELANKIKSDLERGMICDKSQLNEELKMAGAGLASAVANGTSCYYSPNPLTALGFVCSLAYSAFYFEEKAFWTQGSIRFKNAYLKKFNKIELLKKLEIIIKDNDEY